MLTFSSKYCDRLRCNLGRFDDVISIPDLIKIQQKSFDDFMQVDVEANKRRVHGLESILRFIFPITNFSKSVVLEYLEYKFKNPQYDAEDCLRRGTIYKSTLNVKLKLIVFELNDQGKRVNVKFTKTDWVYFGDLPMMTDRGTFIINGTERVVVSQVHRSPGVFFGSEKESESSNQAAAARIVPYRGSWLDFEMSNNSEVLYARIDCRRKFLASTLLYALGYTQEQILQEFYGNVSITVKHNNLIIPSNAKFWLNLVLPEDIFDPRGKVIKKAGDKITMQDIQNWQNSNLKNIHTTMNYLKNRYLSIDIIDQKTGLVILDSGAMITDENLEKIKQLNITSISLLNINDLDNDLIIRNTVLSSKVANTNDALLEIYQIIRAGENINLDIARNVFQNLFFLPEFYSLSAVGRMKLNRALKLDTPANHHCLTKQDIILVIKELIFRHVNRLRGDDIDHLGNRRIRPVGELLENGYRVGFLQLQRICKEKISNLDSDNLNLQSLVNFKPVMIAVREFFSSSQLSQFMNQTNALSEITHKRRISALGPGGLMRDRAGFSVRDVHPTYYGRICPMETPEGQNIGLINSLAAYAGINEYGFIESPCRVVKNGYVTQEIKYLDANEEIGAVVAQVTKLNKDNSFVNDMVMCRKDGEFNIFHAQDVNYMDVSPKQIVSVAASLIAFLENDDANRVLMGANMQRQAVPLIIPQAPMIGTSMERTVSRDAGAVIVSKHAGKVVYVDAGRVIISRHMKTDGAELAKLDTYVMRKFQRSNQNTCIDYRPVVRMNDELQQGDLIADGSVTDRGELALGQNVLVAFMSWQGYNFEDSILISDRLIRDDVFTSIHIETFEITARDTKLGTEEITRDVPNMNDHMLRNLDADGIIVVGSEVQAGDILVGKVTPKGETRITSEEKLLRAIFGAKSADVKDNSLRLPTGFDGTVIDVRIYNRQCVPKNQRLLNNENEYVNHYKQVIDDQKIIYEKVVSDRLDRILLNQVLQDKIYENPAGAIITQNLLNQLSLNQKLQISVKDKKIMTRIKSIKEKFHEVISDIDIKLQDKIDKEKMGVDLDSSILSVVKVYVAVKKQIRVGDKMSGRHGNKGVVSHIVSVSDMPYLADGTPIDIIFNPLGVPSRMNVGQILETHLCCISRAVGQQIKQILQQYRSQQEAEDYIFSLLEKIFPAEDMIHLKKMPKTNRQAWFQDLSLHGLYFDVPVFTGLSDDKFDEMFDAVNLDRDGQMYLYDGRTGDRFDRKVTIGSLYTLKLSHLADEKIHARSIGSYSLITQQPLGGKAQFGGQRFGEMEVWALEAYGAAYTLQEMLTVKSDDVAGRTSFYNTIVKGDFNFQIGTPESFNVLIKELRSLGLNIKLVNEDN